MIDRERIIAGLEDQRRDRLALANDDNDSIFTYDAQVLEEAIALLRAEPCEDAVSREAVITALYAEMSDWNYDYNIPIRRCMGAINALPSVQPAPVARVMTFNEAESMKLCWIEIKFPANVFPAQVVKFFDDSPNATVFRFHVETRDYPLDEYGVKWRCWNVEPTDEQMEATPWL